ncbi:hypothetical protein A3Q56_03746 [Intoshia linei]|uniref:Uncharacterized protein n=1 Tax=Intoshia linei TaxID=1819745 RepID=A0A177B3I9_9BILA|nr:hypothetical protein A3Q56_03746 [Intoshia linei]
MQENESIGEIVVKNLCVEFLKLCDVQLAAIGYITSSMDYKMILKRIKENETFMFNKLLQNLQSSSEFCLPSIMKCFNEWETQVSLHSDRQLVNGIYSKSGHKNFEIYLDLLSCIFNIEILKQLRFHPGYEGILQEKIKLCFRRFHEHSNDATSDQNEFNSATNLFGQLLSTISETRFKIVEKIFLEHLRIELDKVQLNNTQLVVSIIMSLKFVKIKLQPIEDFEMFIEFLHKCGKMFLELKHRDAKHAICGIFVEMMLPVIEIIRHEVNVASLKSLVKYLYNPTFELTSKRKHFLAVFPMITCLLCLSDVAFFMENWFVFTNICLAQIKNRDPKVTKVSIESLYRLLWVYLIRWKGENSAITLNRLQIICSTLIPKNSKNLFPRESPLNLFVRIIHFIGIENLNFAIKEIIYDLLCVGRSSKLLTPDRMIIGIRAFMLICDSLQRGDVKPSLPKASIYMSFTEKLRIKRTYITRNFSNKIAQQLGMEFTYPTIRKAFCSIIRQLDILIGKPYSQLKTDIINKYNEELYSGDKNSKLLLFHTCIMAIPRLMPGGDMQFCELLDILSRLTFHYDEELRKLSVQSLKNLLVEDNAHSLILIRYTSVIVVDLLDINKNISIQCTKILIRLIQHLKLIATNEIKITCYCKINQHKPKEIKNKHNRTGSCLNGDTPDNTIEMIRGCTCFILKNKQFDREEFYELEVFGLLLLCNDSTVMRKLGITVLRETKLLVQSLNVKKSIKNESFLIDEMDKSTVTIMNQILPLVPVHEHRIFKNMTPNDFVVMINLVNNVVVDLAKNNVFDTVSEWDYYAFNSTNLVLTQRQISFVHSLVKHQKYTIHVSISSSNSESKNSTSLNDVSNQSSCADETLNPSKTSYNSSRIEHEPQNSNQSKSDIFKLKNSGGSIIPSVPNIEEGLQKSSPVKLFVDSDTVSQASPRINLEKAKKPVYVDSNYNYEHLNFAPREMLSLKMISRKNVNISNTNIDVYRLLNCEILDPWLYIMSLFMDFKYVRSKCPSVIKIMWPIVINKMNNAFNHLDTSLFEKMGGRFYSSFVESRPSSILSRTSKKINADKLRYLNLWQNYCVMACCIAQPNFTTDNAHIDSNIKTLSVACNPITLISENEITTESLEPAIVDKDSKSSLMSGMYSLKSGMWYDVYYSTNLINTSEFLKTIIPLLKCEFSTIRETVLVALTHISLHSFNEIVNELHSMMRDVVDMRSDNVRRRRRKDVQRLVLLRLFVSMIEGNTNANKLSEVYVTNNGLNKICTEFIEGLLNYFLCDSEREHVSNQHTLILYCKYISILFNHIPIDLRRGLIKENLKHKLFNFFLNCYKRLVNSDSDKYKDKLYKSALIEYMVKVIFSIICCGPVEGKTITVGVIVKLFESLVSDAYYLIEKNEFFSKFLHNLMHLNKSQELNNWFFKTCYGGPIILSNLIFINLMNKPKTNWKLPEMISYLMLTIHFYDSIHLNIQTIARYNYTCIYLKYFENTYCQNKLVKLDSSLAIKSINDSDCQEFHNAAIEKVSTLMKKPSNFTPPAQHMNLMLTSQPSEFLNKFHSNMIILFMSEIFERLEKASTSSKIILLDILKPWLKISLTSIFDSTLYSGTNELENCLKKKSQDNVSDKSTDIVQIFHSSRASHYILNNLLYCTVKFHHLVPSSIRKLWLKLAMFDNVAIIIDFLLINVSICPSMFFESGQFVVSYIAEIDYTNIMNIISNKIKIIEYNDYTFRITEAFPHIQCTININETKTESDNKDDVHSDFFQIPTGTPRDCIHTKSHNNFNEMWVTTSVSTIEQSDDLKNGFKLNLKLPLERIFNLPIINMIIKSCGQSFVCRRHDIAAFLLIRLISLPNSIDWCAYIPLLFHKCFTELDSCFKFIYDNYRILLITLLIRLFNTNDYAQNVYKLLEFYKKYQSNDCDLAFKPTTDMFSSDPEVECEHSELILLVIEFLYGAKEVQMWKYEDQYPWMFLTGSTETGDIFMEKIKSTHKMNLFKCKILQIMRMCVPNYEEFLSAWSDIALYFSFNSPSRHVACRSWQIVRSLNSPLTEKSFFDILARLIETVSDDNVEMQGYVLEIMQTLNFILNRLIFYVESSCKMSTCKAKVDEYKIINNFIKSDDDCSAIICQMFWLVAILLDSDYETEFCHATALMCLVLEKFPLLSNYHISSRIETIYKHISWFDFPGIMDLAINGLTSHVTYLSAWNLLSVIVNNLESVIIHKQRIHGIWELIFYLLPYMVLMYEAPSELCRKTARDIATACSVIDLPQMENLASIMQMYASLNFQKDSSQWIRCVIKYVVADNFEKFSRVLLILSQLLKKSPNFIIQSLLNIIHAIFVQIDLNDKCKDAIGVLFYSVKIHLNGNYHDTVSKIISVCVSKSARFILSPNRRSGNTSWFFSGIFNKELPGRTIQFNVQVKGAGPEALIQSQLNEKEKEKDDVDIECETMNDNINDAKVEEFEVEEIDLNQTLIQNDKESSLPKGLYLKSWQKNENSQIKLRQRLIAFMTSCGQSVNLFRTPSAIFSYVSDTPTSVTHDIRNSVYSSSDELSINDVNIDNKKDHRKMEDKFPVFNNFGFLEFEEGYDKNQMPFDWAVCRSSRSPDTRPNSATDHVAIESEQSDEETSSVTTVQVNPSREDITSDAVSCLSLSNTKIRTRHFSENNKSYEEWQSAPIRSFSSNNIDNTTVVSWFGKMNQINKSKSINQISTLKNMNISPFLIKIISNIYTPAFKELRDNIGTFISLSVKSDGMDAKMFSIMIDSFFIYFEESKESISRIWERIATKIPSNGKFNLLKESQSNIINLLKRVQPSYLFLSSISTSDVTKNLDVKELLFDVDNCISTLNNTLLSISQNWSNMLFKLTKQDTKEIIPIFENVCNLTYELCQVFVSYDSLYDYVYHFYVNTSNECEDVSSVLSNVENVYKVAKSNLSKGRAYKIFGGALSKIQINNLISDYKIKIKNLLSKYNINRNCITDNLNHIYIKLLYDCLIKSIYHGKINVVHRGKSLGTTVPYDDVDQENFIINNIINKEGIVIGSNTDENSASKESDHISSTH